MKHMVAYKQLTTMLTEIEGILNSQPLSPLSQDPSDLSCRTPGHFLIGCPITSFPCPDVTKVPMNRVKFWRCCEQAQ